MDSSNLSIKKNKNKKVVLKFRSKRKMKNVKVGNLFDVFAESPDWKYYTEKTIFPFPFTLNGI